jgi:hypothetical protein
VIHGIRGCFYTASELARLLQEAKLALKLSKFLLKLDRHRFFVSDNIGYVCRDQQLDRRTARHTHVLTA